jgi:hypothetical protein
MWKRLYGYTSLHIEAHDLNVPTRMQLSGDTVVIPRRCPRSGCRDNRRPDAALIEWDFDRIVPFGNPPNAAFKVRSLPRQEPE